MIYAIGDIHGQRAMLDHALALITADGGPDADIVFLGDYTDRGPDSKGVIDHLIAGRDAGRNWRFLMGNHDRYLLRFVDECRQHDPRTSSPINWLNPRLGGTATLASYGIKGEAIFDDHAPNTQETLLHFQTDAKASTDIQLQQAAADAVPQSHLDFIASLPLTIETDDLIFVHAGIRPGVAIADQDPEDLLWIRDGFLNDDTDHGKLIVHGHTALDAPQHFGNRVDLDCGAGYGRPLIPAAFDGRDCYLLTDTGKVPLTPA
jgi:serine/threonine protein phosphatase 1